MAASMEAAKTTTTGTLSSGSTLDASTLESAILIPVYDENGLPVEFGTIFKDQKVIVVLIRHFLCGFCQAYVKELGNVPKSSLDTASTRIVVIGCGEWSVIKQYRENATFPYEVYAEPTLRLYTTLGLISNTEMAGKGEKRAYAPSMGMNLWAAFKQSMTLIGSLGKVGPISQLGGDFVLGPGNTASFVWRMRNMEDHIDVTELMTAAGVAYPV